jgi:hypothetical protein
MACSTRSPRSSLTGAHICQHLQPGHGLGFGWLYLKPVGYYGADPQQRCRVAKFLEARGHVEKALEVARDPDYRFELAAQLDNFDIAVEIATQLRSEARWKQLGEMALADGRLPLAEKCLQQSMDMSGMMLMHSATGNREGMEVRRRSTHLSKYIVCTSSLALCCVCAIARSFVFGWRPFSSVSLCIYICTMHLHNVFAQCIGLGSLLFGAHAVRRVPRPPLTISLRNTYAVLKTQNNQCPWTSRWFKGLPRWSTGISSS